MISSENSQFNPTPNQIIDKLYLGDCDDSENLKVLLELGVKYILIVGNNLYTHFPQVRKE